MFSSILNLLRVRQWYKNIIVFLVLFFAVASFSLSMLNVLFLSFISLCLMSSVNYIINDYKDIEKDKLDKYKSKRALASGKISKAFAIIIALLLFVFSLFLGFNLNLLFGFLLIGFFILTQLYTFWLKEKVFIDIIMISINFIIRAVSGAIVINIYISSWFLSGIFLLAIFLVISKRYGESLDKIKENRKTLNFYTEELTKMLLVAFMSILIVFYIIYVNVVHDTYWFVLTIPIFTFAILRYFTIIYKNSDLARHAEKVLIRKDMLILGTLWILSFLFAILDKLYNIVKL